MKSFKELRSDPHRPSSLDPADYVFVGAADDHPGDSYLEVRHDVLAQHGVETGTSDWQSSVNVPFYDAREDGRPNFRCHHCGKHGSNIRYFVFFLHKPSKQVVVVGQICAKKLNMGSKEELDLQKRADDFRRMQQRHQWVDNHQDEFTYLKEYDEQHTNGGWYSEFFEALWNGIQRFGSLTDKQLGGLRKWMERGKPWEYKAAAKTDEHFAQTMRDQGVTYPGDADRHKGEVTHISDEPTERQVAFIRELADDLDLMVDIPETRKEASDLINGLKAKLIEKREQERPAPDKATEKQISFINRLMDDRKIPLEDRRKATEMLDAGLTKSQASRWIERLQELPRLEDHA